MGHPHTAVQRNMRLLKRGAMIGVGTAACLAGGPAVAASPWSSSPPIASGDSGLSLPWSSVAPGTLTGPAPFAFQVTPAIGQPVAPATWTAIGPGAGGDVQLPLTSTPNASPTVASHPSGNSVAVWREADGLHAQLRHPDGTREPALVVVPVKTGESIADFRVAMGGRFGDQAAIVAVRRRPNRPETLMYLHSCSPIEPDKCFAPPGARWSPVVGPLSAYRFDAIAMDAEDAGGFQVAAALTYADGRGRIVKMRDEYWAPRTVWTQSAAWLDIAAGEQDRATVAWIARTSDRTLRTRVMRPILDVSGFDHRQGTTGPMIVHAVGVPLRSAPADLSSDATGRATLVWQRTINNRAVVFDRAEGSGWGTTRAVTLRTAAGTTPNRVTDIAVDVNSRGDATVLWQALEQPTDTVTVGAMYRRSGGVFGPIEHIVRHQDSRGMPRGLVHVATAAPGRVAGTYTLASADVYSVYAAYRPAAALAPDVTAITGPATVGTGKGATIRFTASRAGRVIVTVRELDRPPIRPISVATMISVVNCVAGANTVTIPAGRLTRGVKNVVTVGLDASRPRLAAQGSPPQLGWTMDVR